MNAHLISKTNEVFNCIQNMTLKYHNIDNPELRAYSTYLRKFLSSLAESGKDDYWREKKWELRRIIFLLCAAPLEKDYLIREVTRITQLLEDDIASCRKLYPNHFENFSNLITIAKALISSEIDVIKTEVESIFRDSSESTAILIKDTKLIPIVEKNIKDQGSLKVEIESISSLKSEYCYDNLIIIGPANPRWYPDFVFSSPKAKTIHVIKYRWMKGTWRPSNVFPNSLKNKKLPKFVNEDDEQTAVDGELDPEFFLPPLDFSRIIRNAEQEFVEDDDEIEYIDAIIIYLENEQIVFLDFDDQASVYIVNIDDETTPIKKARVRDLEQGVFLLLRTTRGGDYIIPLADRIMGGFAENARSIQKKWKDRLRRNVREHGMHWVVKELRGLGSHKAKPINIRNWMSYRSIKTNEFSDFHAIMKLVELGDSSHEIWEQMELIHSAHIQAGHHISKLLMNVVRTAEFNDLIKLGIMEFELPDRDAGSMTAFRIKHVSSETAPVPSTRIGFPFTPNQ